MLNIGIAHQYVETRTFFQDNSQIFRFDEEHIQLGQVKQGEIREMIFRFKNTGKEKLEIDLVSSCECTSLDWTSTPIIPGEFGEIKAVFDSSQKEKSETVDVDIILKNTDPKTGNPIMLIVDYTFELVK
jgi:hypothetical protein